MEKTTRRIIPLTFDEVMRYNSYRMTYQDTEVCWPWVMGKIKGGYGMFSYRRTDFLAHRIAYYLHFNVDPIGFLVCHDCDNPPCCNPNHLWLGSTKENQQDALIKGRRSDSILNEELVLTIRSLNDKSYEQKEIAHRLGISAMVISRVIRRTIWDHV